MTQLDRSTGRILERLNQLDLDRRTLVLFTPDNDAPSKEPGCPPIG